MTGVWQGAWTGAWQGVRKASGVLALSAGLAVAVCGAARATVLLDQVSLPGSGASGNASNGGTFGRAQTFTVGIAGVLDSVEVTMDFGTPTTLRILATSGGLPVGGAAGSTVLATSSSATASGTTFTFDLSPAALAVAVGDVLAIEIFGGNWLYSDDPYAGGSSYFFNVGGTFSVDTWTSGSADTAFRTFVEDAPVLTAVPEPASLALFGAGLAGLVGAGAWGRRRRRA